MARTSSAGSTGRDGLARAAMGVLGGCYSAGLGIDVDAGDAEVERWFLAASLSGTRISASIAGRTFSVLNDAGLHRVAQARHIPWHDLVKPGWWLSPGLSVLSTPLSRMGSWIAAGDRLS